ncbi:TetR family transcriptional regulator [Rugosimonospora acidiphila]|uniref:TetR family transcriptional regulator n=1 Tax=Rugosimonospora acidiphila TaxID=556531 RepID=A0ABP9S7C0_9ACTN
MSNPTGLRERKKARTRDAISEAAISLFLAHGFDGVSVADIAAAAEISKPTLFRYFPAKEDLVLHRIADHAGESARVVRERPDGTSPLNALHAHQRDGLDRRDPVTGLNDHPQVLAFYRLMITTPSLVARMAQYQFDNENALTEALGGDTPARLRAAGFLASHRVLAETNWRKLTAGRGADEVYPEALADVDLAFELLRHGSGDPA